MSRPTHEVPAHDRRSTAGYRSLDRERAGAHIHSARRRNRPSGTRVDFLSGRLFPIETESQFHQAHTIRFGFGPASPDDVDFLAREPEVPSFIVNPNGGCKRALMPDSTPDDKRFARSSARPSRAFTLIELLV